MMTGNTQALFGEIFTHEFEQLWVCRKNKINYLNDGIWRIISYLSFCFSTHIESFPITMKRFDLKRKIVRFKFWYFPGLHLRSFPSVSLGSSYDCWDFMTFSQSNLIELFVKIKINDWVEWTELKNAKFNDLSSHLTSHLSSHLTSHLTRI